MATVTERLELLIDAKTGGAVSGIKAVTAETKTLGAAQTDATGKTSLMDKGLGKLGISSEAAGTALKVGLAAGAVVAGSAMAKFAKDSVAATVQVADGIRKVQQVSGATAETASKLIAITDDYGISAETTAKNFGRLAVNIANGKPVFDDFGITIVKNKEGNVDFEKTLLNVAEAYKNTEDPAQRMKLVTDAFGKSGKDLIPILEQGKAGIREMFADVPQGQIFDQAKLDAAKQYSLAIDNLQDSMKELQYVVGNALIPTLTDLANGLATSIRQANQLTGPVGGLGTVVGLLVENINPLSSSMHAVSAAQNLWNGNIRQGSEDLVRSIPGVGNLAAGVGTLTGVFGKGSEESNKFADAQKRLEEAQTNLARLAANGKQGTDEYAGAQREARDAGEQLAGVQKRVGEALEEVTPKAEATKTKLEDLAAAQWASLDASNALANAQLGLQGAYLNVESALVAQTKVLEDNTASSLEGREAQLRLDQSILGVASAAAVGYEAETKLHGGQVTAEGSAKAQRDALEELKRKFPKLAPQIDAHIFRLNAIPAGKHTQATFGSDQAAVDAYLSKLALIKQNIYDIARTQADNPEAFFSRGGWVHGSGSGDTVRAMLSPGEFVVSKAMLAGTAPIPERIGALMPMGPLQPKGAATAVATTSTAPGSEAYHFHFERLPENPVRMARMSAAAMRANQFLVGR